MPESGETRTIRPLLTHRAILGDGVDAAVPAHYGEILREQRRLLAGRAVVDLGHLEILEVSGADAMTWMTTVTSQVLTGRDVGDSATLAVLSPQGRVEHLASAVVVSEETLWLVTDPGRRAGLRRYLEMMRFAARVEITDRDDLRILGGVAASSQIPALAALELPAPRAVHTDGHPAVAAGGVAYGPDPEDPVGWVLSIHEAADLEQLPWTREVLAGTIAAEALRIADHRPRLATEVDERSIPHELDLLRTAVHTEKGCYRGQETVAKVLNLGQPPRRLVMLHIDGSQDVHASPGSTVHLGEKQVGIVTSAAMHVDLGPIALAVVRRAVPLEGELVVRAIVGGHEEGSAVTEVDLLASQEPIVIERVRTPRPPTARL